MGNESSAFEYICDALDRIDSNLAIIEVWTEENIDLKELSEDRIRQMKVKLNSLLNKVLESKCATV